MIHLNPSRFPLFNQHIEVKEPFRDARPLPIDPNIHPDDREAVIGQNGAILERLRAGPATNVELAAMSLKYTSRLSDLRAAGHVIECKRGPGRVNVYTLKEANQ